MKLSKSIGDNNQQPKVNIDGGKGKGVPGLLHGRSRIRWEEGHVYKLKGVSTRRKMQNTTKERVVFFAGVNTVYTPDASMPGIYIEYRRYGGFW